ncbi:hypothetical protein AtEden1_Chr4g0284781 [Arabidopsis thaliana]
MGHGFVYISCLTAPKTNPYISYFDDRNLYICRSNEDVSNNGMEKKALTTAESVRVVEKHPWVITFPNHEDSTFLFDPLER